jgi:hypothetical protein
MRDCHKKTKSELETNPFPTKEETAAFVTLPSRACPIHWQMGMHVVRKHCCDQTQLREYGGAAAADDDDDDDDDDDVLVLVVIDHDDASRYV